MVHKIKIGLVISIIFIIFLVFSNIWFYIDLQNQITILEDDIEIITKSAHADILSLSSDYNLLQSEYNSLQSQLGRLEAPKLIKVNLWSDQHRPESKKPYLRIYGFIFNTGSRDAVNSKIHVIAYQDEVVAIDKYIILGTITGEWYATVDKSLNYEGESLTDWSVTLEWALY